MKKKCLFYIHNFLESNHYAIMSFLDFMKDYVDFTICAKYFYDNHKAIFEKFSNKILLNELSVTEEFWKGFDIVHIVFDGLPSLSIVALSKIFDIPYIITFHGGYDTNTKIYNPDICSKLAFFVNGAKYATVVCKKDKIKLQELHCLKNKLLIIPPSIEEKYVQINQDSELNNNITVVGRFIPKKGIDIAIKALQELPNDYKLYIIGDGDEKEYLQELASDLMLNKRITWLGEQPLETTLEIIKQNSILWHPARKDKKGNAEGIPQVILYAMAMGKLIITTNTGSISSVVKNKKNGIFFKTDIPESLSKQTIKYNNLKSKKIRNKAQNDSKQFFKQNQFNIWINLYN